jgi:hypothetical protein
VTLNPAVAQVLTYLAALPLERVGEIHLAGFHRETDSLGDPLLIDSHGSAVDAAVCRPCGWRCIHR